MLNPFFSTNSFPELKLNMNHPQTIFQISRQIECFALLAHESSLEIVIVCIGTDRSTGDALGPLTGAKLQLLAQKHPVFGTLDDPVHATNLVTTLELIHEKIPHSFIIAVDACLGKLASVGSVTIGQGALKPGAAVSKELPSVGDAHITGIVNVGGFMEHLVLQSTRLSVVMKMADIIANGIALGLRKITPPPLYSNAYLAERQAR